MPRKIACRYGKNGYFGICGCLQCSPPADRVTAPAITLKGDPDALLALVSGVPFTVEDDKLTLAPFFITRSPNMPRTVFYRRERWS